LVGCVALHAGAAEEVFAAVNIIQIILLGFFYRIFYFLLWAFLNAFFFLYFLIFYFASF
jgi:hypothetical protein